MSGVSSYFSAAFDSGRRDEAIDFARAAQLRLDFDTVVVTGVSGTLMGGVIAHALDCNLVVVRKPDDVSTHSYRRIEGDLGRRWVFLDDLIDTGSTRRRVLREVRAHVAKVRETYSSPDFLYGYSPAPAYVESCTFVGTVAYQDGQLYNGRHEEVGFDD